MIILGIDPGTASTGYGVIRIRSKKQKTKNNPTCLAYGLIKTSPSSTPPERLRKINNELSKIIKKYRPEILSIENIYFFRNLKTAIPVSQAKGVILLTAAKNKVPIQEFTPLQIKSSITKNGWAEKKDVQKSIKRILRLKEVPKPDDAADALAAALTCFMRRRA
jgi:crossover junction endodeoxyribonuclease RuvC